MSAADRRKYRKPNIADEGRDYDDRDAEITRLRAELARAKSCACADCNTEILQLRAENEALRAACIKARLALAHAEEKAPGLYTDYYNALDAALAAKGE